LLDVYLAEVIGRKEFERKRQEGTQTQHSLRQQLHQLEAQAQQQVNVATLAHGIEAFSQRLRPTLAHLTFAQRRQLVELLIDHVIVTDGQVEIRYVVPTGPKGETTPFCHLRLDYFGLTPCRIGVRHNARSFPASFTVTWSSQLENQPIDVLPRTAQTANTVYVVGRRL
jgi:site-specific DNA recombinase